MFGFFRFLLIVILIVITGYLVVVMRFYLPYPERKMEYEYLVPSRLKTGDIVMVSYDGFQGAFQSTLTQMEWNHTGIVYRCPETGMLYVLEIGLYGRGYNGAVKIPFDIWYHINRKHQVSYLPLEGKELDPKILLKSFNKFAHISFDFFSHRWLRFLFTKPYYRFTDEDYKSKYVCFEISIHTLQEAGVFKKKLSASSYSPSHVFHRNIPTNQPYSYGLPHYIVKNNLSKYSSWE